MLEKAHQLPNREEWLKKRKNYIGGSDAGAILGVNPWLTNVDLWEIKTGRKEQDLSGNKYVQYGLNAEDSLRDLFRCDYPDYDVFYIENNMFLNTDSPWAHASLDGWIHDRETNEMGILEIKTANKWPDTDWTIPLSYYCQLAHYLMVTDYDFAIMRVSLKEQSINKGLHIDIRDYYFTRQFFKRLIDTLRKEEQRFYQYIISDERPPAIGEVKDIEF